MAIVFLGADFVDAPLTLLERVEAATNRISEDLTSRPEDIPGAISVLTCNRAEFYLDALDPEAALPWLIDVIARSTEMTMSEVAQVFRVLTGGSVVRHLFAVASGLESMVVGESEITGQVRRAFHQADTGGHTTAPMNRMFQRAQQVAKSVAATTGVGRSGRSIVHTALDLANVTHDDVSQRRALIVGTGAYARVVTTALKKRGVKSIQVYSRSGRAPVFASQHGIEAVEADHFENAVANADWVVSASGQPGYAITANLIHRALSARTSAQQLTMIDVALSPDVDPAVGALEGSRLITLDTLRQHNPVHHREALLHAERLIEDAAAHFETTERTRRVDPLITALRSDIDMRVEQELDIARRNLDADQAREVERAVRRITRAVLHTPTVRAKDLAQAGREDEYAQALSLLFDLQAQES